MNTDLDNVCYYLERYLICEALVPFKDFVLTREKLNWEQKGAIIDQIDIIAKDMQDLKTYLVQETRKNNE